MLYGINRLESELEEEVYLYRFEDHTRGHFDGVDGDLLYTSVEVKELKFRILKETPKGCWIDRYGQKRWVSDHTRKRFAYRTKEDAAKGFIARKNAQLRILNKKVSNVKSAIRQIEWKYKDAIQ